MAKKKPGMTPEEQSEAFRAAVKSAVAAGDLNPDEADAAFERVMGNVRVKKEDSQGAEK